MEIATGAPSPNPVQAVPPMDESQHPALASETAVYPNDGPHPMGAPDGRDTTGEAQAQWAAGEADAAAAMSAGMDARTGMLAAYQADMLPYGASYGNELVIPQPVSGPGVGITDLPAFEVHGIGYQE